MCKETDKTVEQLDTLLESVDSPEEMVMINSMRTMVKLMGKLIDQGVSNNNTLATLVPQVSQLVTATGTMQTDIKTMKVSDEESLRISVPKGMRVKSASQSVSGRLSRNVNSTQTMCVPKQKGQTLKQSAKIG